MVAVILFGALSYTVANMMRSGNAQRIGEEQASLMADEIMGYAQQLRRAVKDMQISNGCEDEDISFENSVVAGYTNGTNTDCQVFHPSGGGLTYVAPSSDFGIGTEWIYGGRLNVLGVGTDCTSGTSCADIYVVLEGIKLPICNAINEKLDISTPSEQPPQQDDPLTFTRFTGTFTFEEAIEDTTNDNVLRGRFAGCTETSGGGSYFYYQTLLAR